MRERVIELFKKGRGSYGISVELGIGVKEVYHYIEQYEKTCAVRKYKRAS